jgi:starch phosphorylase
MHEPLVAYVSMEIAVASQVATYGGGLGVLAGDLIRAAADAGYPMAGVTLLYRDGYFRQHLDASGAQHEEPLSWRPDAALEQLAPVVTIPISGRPVHAGVWRYTVTGADGHRVPVYFLDTDRDDNDDAARALTSALYGGDARYRLEQEALLGLGTVAMLRALGHERVGTYHMNEGHAALLILALLEETRTIAHGLPTHDDLARVRERCVFTTHTPVPAGHDCFGLDLAHEVLGGEYAATLRALNLAEYDVLNMTHLALRASRFTNAVAMKHGEVSRAMFPDADVHAITNGVHAGTWTSEPFQTAFRPPHPRLAPRQLAVAPSSRDPPERDRRRARRRKARADRTRRARDGQAARPEPLHDRHRAPRHGLQAKRPDSARSRPPCLDRAKRRRHPARVRR